MRLVQAYGISRVSWLLQRRESTLAILVQMLLWEVVKVNTYNLQMMYSPDRMTLNHEISCSGLENSYFEVETFHREKKVKIRLSYFKVVDIIVFGEQW